MLRSAGLIVLVMFVAVSAPAAPTTESLIEYWEETVRTDSQTRRFEPLGGYDHPGAALVELSRDDYGRGWSPG